MLPWAPWSCCNSSVLLVCDSIWQLIPHSGTGPRRRRRSVTPLSPQQAGRRLRHRPTGDVPWNPGGSTYSLEMNRSVEHVGLKDIVPWKPVDVGDFDPRLFSASNFTRRRRSPGPDEKTPKKKPPRAPKRKKKKPEKPKKPVSKALAEGFPQFSLHGAAPGPIGAADTDSPFESQLDVLLPQLELEASISQLDGWYRRSKISRQALQERIFHRVGCGEALSKTVFWVIGMAMTTLLTVWIFQVREGLAVLLYYSTRENV